jgi:glutaredoxin
MYETYFTGEITLHVAQTVNTEQLQHYIPQKLGLIQVPYIVVNTLHKGDKVVDDDSNNNKLLWIQA